MKSDTQKPRAGSTTLVTHKQAADTKALITNGTDSYPEDSFYGSYAISGGFSSLSILEPTYKPGVLKALTTLNNVLSQCIEAMEVNIDGTGHTIALIEGQPENEKEKKLLIEFFDEPYPNKSMVTLRRELRADLESTGNGYLEIIRNLKNEVVMMNNTASSEEMRIVRYDDPVVVPRKITRGGVELEVQVRVRERRYVQMINGKKIFFKEFGASRDLNRDTGEWSASPLPVEQRASEIMHFTLVKEAKTPYGSPRWINQLPSVLGSRKAEEFNLEFFDSGGLPPVLVVVQGGYLGEGVKETLQAHLSGAGASKHRAAIVEAISSSGSLDSSGSVKVTVERFGAERMQDAMFQTYDKNTEDHVRCSFRLPPIFLGRSQDYNLASAITGYLTAEAQVFAPERLEFDERMWWICNALGVKSYTFKSKPMTLSDVAAQVGAVKLAMDQKAVEVEGAISELNKLTGLNLKYEKPREPEKPPTLAHIDPLTNLPYRNPVQPVHPNDPKVLAAQAKGAPPSPPHVPIPQAPKEAPKLRAIKSEVVVGLADQWARILGLAGPCNLSDREVAAVKLDVSSLQGDDLKLFNEVLATKSLVSTSDDLEGLSLLCGHASTMQSE